MKNLIETPKLEIKQCETRSEWSVEWHIRGNFPESFACIFETKDGKRAILYGQHEQHWNYWEVVLEP